jgi:hypothetical protein
MVACALRPRPTTTVGAAATMARVAHFLLPGFPYVSGWLTRLGLQNRPQAASSSGNLFTPSGAPRQVEGGWRAKAHRPSLTVVVGAALLLGGLMIALKRHGQQSDRTIRREI